MIGTKEEPGITVLTVADLFDAIDQTSEDKEYRLTMSYMEVEAGAGIPCESHGCVYRCTMRLSETCSTLLQTRCCLLAGITFCMRSWMLRRDCRY